MSDHDPSGPVGPESEPTEAEQRAYAARALADATTVAVAELLSIAPTLPTSRYLAYRKKVADELREAHDRYVELTMRD